MVPNAPVAAPPRHAQTIGAVCKALLPEFPDISISKIRYLEDQKLLNPKRTAGGYRLYSPREVARLRTILRLQRDEFLPLRVIRQELAAGRTEPDEAQGAGASRSPRRATVRVQGRPTHHSLEEVLEETGADRALVRELEEYGVIAGERRDGEVLYEDTEKEIVRAVTELAQTRRLVNARPFPQLNILGPEGFEDLKYEQFNLEGYDPHPAIKAEVSV